MRISIPVGFAVTAALAASFLPSAGCKRSETPARAPNVTRREAARALVKARGESAATGCQTPYFADVPCSDRDWGWIEKLRTDGLTAGCGKPLPSFCPDEYLYRAQAAMFVSRAATGGESSVPVTYGPDPATGRSYSCDPAGPNLRFRDIKSQDIFCQHVHYLWAKGAIAEAETYLPAADLTETEFGEMVRKGFEVRK